MLQGLLAILLIIFIVMVVGAMLVVRILYRSINRLRDAARSAMGMDSGEAGRRSRGGSSEGQGDSARQQGRRTQTSAGTTIIDNRDPEQAERKIFADDEGEYVEFEENK